MNLINLILVKMPKGTKRKHDEEETPMVGEGNKHKTENGNLVVQDNVAMIQNPGRRISKRAVRAKRKIRLCL